MHDAFRQARQPIQCRRVVEISHHRDRAGRTQVGAAIRLAGQREHAEAVAHQWQQPHADIAAPEDQQARLAEAASRSTRSMCRKRIRCRFFFRYGSIHDGIV
jgi:C4-dicarboxylate-specific signal transduction histidine kinase